jgi:hypothetical protein
LYLMRVCASHNPDLPCIQGVHPHPTPGMRPVFPVRRKRTRSSYAVQMGQTHAKDRPCSRETNSPGGARRMLRHGRRGTRDTGRGGRGDSMHAAATQSMGRRGAGRWDVGVRDAGTRGCGDPGRGGAGTLDAGVRGRADPGEKQTHRWPSGGHCRPVRPTVRSGRAGPWPTRHRDRELLVCGAEPGSACDSADSRTPVRGVLVRRLVLRDDVRRNAPALIDLVSALLRPLPDLSTALAAGASARPAAPSRSARFARVLHIVG